MPLRRSRAPLPPGAAAHAGRDADVTDFTRRAQAMVRYRMNDLLELGDHVCRCGSPLQAVRRIEGRRDDVFLLAAGDGTRRLVTPDVPRNAVVRANRNPRLPHHTDWRGPVSLTVRVWLGPADPGKLPRVTRRWQPS